MSYFNGFLGAFAAISLAELIPNTWSVYGGGIKVIGGQKATAIGVVPSGLVESFIRFKHS
jgi:hypothetical protein